MKKIIVLAIAALALGAGSVIGQNEGKKGKGQGNHKEHDGAKRDSVWHKDGAKHDGMHHDSTGHKGGEHHNGAKNKNAKQ